MGVVVNSTYDKFASFYNALWSEKFAKKVIDPLQNLISNWGHPLAGAKILNVASGAGHLDHLLVSRGAFVCGLEASPALIEFARTNAKEAEFSRWHFGEAISFTHKFHIAISLYDSLNYVKNIEQLEDVFRQVHHQLEDSGILIFDVNNAHGHATRWQNQIEVQFNQNHASLSFHYDREKSLATCRIQGVLDESSFNEVHKQISLNPDEVRACLLRAGFREVAAIEPLTYQLPAEPGRDWFVAVR